jgi:hypothetical protein
VRDTHDGQLLQGTSGDVPYSNSTDRIAGSGNGLPCSQDTPCSCCCCVVVLCTCRVASMTSRQHPAAPQRGCTCCLGDRSWCCCHQRLPTGAQAVTALLDIFKYRRFMEDVHFTVSRRIDSVRWCQGSCAALLIDTFQHVMAYRHLRSLIEVSVGARTGGCTKQE